MQLTCHFVSSHRIFSHSGKGLSYLPARLHRLAGRYENPMPESTITPYSGTMNLAADSDRQKIPLFPNGTGNLSIEFHISDGRRVFRETVQKINIPMQTKPEFVNILRSLGIDSQPGRPVRQPCLTHRPARLYWLAESIPWDRLLGSLNVFKFGIWRLTSRNNPESWLFYV